MKVLIQVNFLLVNVYQKTTSVLALEAYLNDDLPDWLCFGMRTCWWDGTNGMGKLKSVSLRN